MDAWLAKLPEKRHWKKQDNSSPYGRKLWGFCVLECVSTNSLFSLWVQISKQLGLWRDCEFLDFWVSNRGETYIPKKYTKYAGKELFWYDSLARKQSRRRWFVYLLRDCSFVVCLFLQKRVSGRRTHFWLSVLSLPKTLHHDFDEVPNRRLQPFIVEDTHI